MVGNTSGESRRRTVNTKANNGTRGKTGRHNLSQEKGPEQRLKQRLIVDDLISAGLGTICSDFVTRILNKMLDSSTTHYVLSFHEQP